jgi:hypothetical protein
MYYKITYGVNHVKILTDFLFRRKNFPSLVKMKKVACTSKSCIVTTGVCLLAKLKRQSHEIFDLHFFS